MLKKVLFVILCTHFMLVTVHAQRGGFGGWGGGFGGFGGMQEQDTPLVDNYDRNGDGWLNAEERAAARQSSPNRQSNMGWGGFGNNSGRSVTSGPRLTPADVKTYPENALLYDLQILRTLFLEFENDDWEAELEDFYHTDVEVPAKLTIDDKTYENVGVRFRGNFNSYRMVNAGQKRPFNLSLDYINKDQDIDGYQTLNLLNASTDPTFMRQVLFHYISSQYMSTLKANYVRVVINGESWGIYINMQQFNSDFIKEEFDTRKGARWKVPGSMGGGGGGLQYFGENLQQYKNVYEIKSKDDPNSWAALINLCKVLNQTPTDQLVEALEPILDIDNVLKFLSLEKVMINNDGYWTRASDYLIYQGKDGRFRVFAYDTSEIMSEAEGGFGGFGSRGGGGGGIRLEPYAGAYDADKPLLSKLLAVPSLQERYMGYIRNITENWMDWNKIEPLVNQFKELIAADVESDTRKIGTTAAFYSGIGTSGEQSTGSSRFRGGFGGRGGGMGSNISIKDFVEQRREYLLSIPEVRQAVLP